MGNGLEDRCSPMNIRYSSSCSIHGLCKAWHRVRADAKRQGSGGHLLEMQIGFICSLLYPRAISKAEACGQE